VGYHSLILATPYPCLKEREKKNLGAWKIQGAGAVCERPCSATYSWAFLRKLLTLPWPQFTSL
jgi:hypothetical protein